MNQVVVRGTRVTHGFSKWLCMSLVSASRRSKKVVDRYWKGDTFMAKLFPSIAANASGHLQVSPDHSIFWEECGFTTGIPVVYLHGGPGGGIDESDR